MKKINLILIGIIVLATVLRLYNLSGNPPHLTSDEASLGYNAYSILQTGKDEHGESFPVIFQSFGDWKPGLYIYLTVPFVAVFGLNEFSTRIVGALSGVIAVLLIFLITKSLFPKSQIAYFTSFSLALIPWHIHFSRGAWEANLALTLILAGVYFFLKGIQEKSKFILFSAIFFAFPLWAYQGAKLGSAITVICLGVAYFKDLIKIPKKDIVIAIIVGLLIASPVILSVLSDRAGRLEIYSVFSYERSQQIIDDILVQGNETNPSISYYLYHSEPLNFFRGILGRWTNHYSGRFLFFEGDWSNPRHTVPNAGALLFLDLLFLLSGLVYLVRSRINSAVLFIFLWLVLAPLPSALSRDSVHAIRSLNLTIPLALILGVGAHTLWQFLKVKKTGSILLAVIVLGYLTNFIYYLDQYWVHAPIRNSKDWNYGYKQIVEKVTPLQNKYSEVVVQQDYAQPYIFFLFYQKYDPAKYQAIAKDVYLSSKFGDVGFVSGFDNLKFKDIHLPSDRSKKNILLIGDSFKLPESEVSDSNVFNIKGEINYLNNNPAFKLVEVK